MKYTGYRSRVLFLNSTKHLPVFLISAVDNYERIMTSHILLTSCKLTPAMEIYQEGQKISVFTRGSGVCYHEDIGQI